MVVVAQGRKVMISAPIRPQGFDRATPGVRRALARVRGL